MAEYPQRKFKIKGDSREFIAQAVPAGWYLDELDRMRDENGNILRGKYIKMLLDHVLVSPRMKPDDFTGKGRELNLIVRECERVIDGDPVEIEGEGKKNALPPGESE
ncbi:MAG: hypothetical protein LBJ10_02670 [Clostridiales bacterium]|jgi:hypothetical protein|nr:hypothetical protein [Clostridiales bacterium]